MYVSILQIANLYMYKIPEPHHEHMYVGHGMFTLQCMFLWMSLSLEDDEQSSIIAHKKKLLHSLVWLATILKDC